MNQNFLDMLSAFLEEHVDFMIVGAFALSAYGYTRATGDLDFWIGPGPTNGEKVLRALVTFGAPVADLTAADFADPDVILQIGVEPERIDILTSIDGVGYAEAQVRRSFVEVAGMSVPCGPP